MRKTLGCALVLSLLAIAAPAAAAPASYPWAMARCVDGSLSPTLVHEPDIEYFVVTGTATQCEAPTATTVPTGYAIAWWGSGNGSGTISDWGIRMFPPAAQPWQPVTVPFGAAAFRDRPGHYATCLMEAAPRAADAPIWEPYRAVPVTCLSVTVTQAEGEPPVATATPLPANSPEVAQRPLRKPDGYTGEVVPWIDDENGGDGTGNCGTCY
jgi:hypothetical protein